MSQMLNLQPCVVYYIENDTEKFAAANYFTRRINSITLAISTYPFHLWRILKIKALETITVITLFRFTGDIISFDITTATAVHLILFMR